jgi:hypothetical protein
MKNIKLIAVFCLAFVLSVGLGSYVLSCIKKPAELPVDDELLRRESEWHRLEDGYTIQIVELDQEIDALKAQIEAEKKKTAEARAVSNRPIIEGYTEAQMNAVRSQLAKKDNDIAALNGEKTILSDENARLRQSLQDQGLSLDMASTDAEKAERDVLALAAVKAAYSRYTASNKDTANLKEFLENPDVLTLFPDFNQYIYMLNQQYAESGYKEGVVNLANVVETALRIRNPDTRQRYLTGVKARFRTDPIITERIDFLIKKM